MAKPVYPCLWFDRQAKEAAQLYCSVFKNSEIVSETPTVVSFKLNGKKILALNGGPVFQINPSISLFVSCDSVKETDRIWNALIEGGSAYIPIGSYPWSEHYGWLKDRYGMTWQIFSTGKNDGEMRILPAMLFTDKQFGRGVEAISFYLSVFSDSAVNVMELYHEDDVNAGKILYSEFSLNKAEIVLMDGPGDHHYTFNEAVSFVIECENQQEIDYYWEKLTEGGEESMCGWLKDKFGVSWQVVPEILTQLMNDPEKAPKVFESFRNMRKLEIDKLYKG